MHATPNTDAGRELYTTDGVQTMTKSERYEEMAQFVRQISRFTKGDECQACNQSGLHGNPACSDHEPWKMPIDDACDTVHSIISRARQLVSELRL